MARSDRFDQLWRNPDFRRLWGGETISMFGSQITAVALPLTAALYLDATPLQMGLLTASGSAPFLVLSLFAGVWVDHTRRRPILIAANLLRGLLLGLIPLLALVGALHIGFLIGITFLVGTLTMLFELAYPAFVPNLVERGQLVEANSKLSVSGSIANIGGPGLAGLLVQTLSAPFALILDGVSFIVAAICLLCIRRPEPRPRRAAEARSIRREVGEGVRLTFSNSVLRAGACSAASYNFFWNVIQAILVLYVVRHLGMTPGVFGLVGMIGSIGALFGALVTAYIARKYGAGPTIVASAALSCTALLLLPLIASRTAGAVLLALAFFLRGLGLTGWNVQITSLQQSTVPVHLLGRMNSSYLLFSLGAGSAGALLGGFLGQSIGLRPTLTVGALGVALAWLWLLFSPMRTIQELPEMADPPSTTQEQARWAKSTPA